MAHLLEHLMFKGTPGHPQVWKALAGPRGAIQRQHVERPDELLRDAAGDGGEPGFRARLEADRMVNSLIKKEDLDSEMTVVRNEFERGENTPSGVLSKRMPRRRICGTTTASRRSGSGGHRDGADRPLAGVLPQVLPAGQRVLIVAGKFDEAKTLAKVRNFRADSAAGAEAGQDVHGGTGAGRGAGGGAAAGGGRGRWGACYHVCAASHEDMAPLQVLANILSTRPSGRRTRGWWRRRRRRARRHTPRRATTRACSRRMRKCRRTAPRRQCGICCWGLSRASGPAA